MKTAQVVNAQTGKVVKTDVTYAEACRLAKAYTKNSTIGATYFAAQPKYNSVDGWQ